MRALLSLSTLLVLGSSARAEDDKLPSPLVVVKQTKATSVGQDDDKPAVAARAFDGDEGPGMYTQWCTKDGHAKGQSVTLVLTQPRAVDYVQIAADKTISGMKIVTDQGSFAVTRDERGVPFAKPTGKTSSITLELTDVDESKGSPACVADITLNENHQELVLLHDVAATAPARLPAALVRASKAMKSCSPAAIAATVAFPLEYDYIGGGDGAAHGKLEDAGAVAKVCKGRGFGTADADSESMSYAPGKVVVRAGDFKWVLAWKGGTWKLVAVEGEGPGNGRSKDR